MIEMTYHTIGAINERLALEAYRRMAAILEHLGENEMAAALMVPMRNDEAAHLSYYRTYARQLRPSLAAWQLAAVRAPDRPHLCPGRGRREARQGSARPRGLLQLESDPDELGHRHVGGRDRRGVRSPTTPSCARSCATRCRPACASPASPPRRDMSRALFCNQGGAG